jgi:hypothetical protein
MRRRHRTGGKVKSTTPQAKTARPDDDPEAAKVINLRDAARDRRTDFTIGIRYHQAPTERKAA